MAIDYEKIGLNSRLNNLEGMLREAQDKLVALERTSKMLVEANTEHQKDHATGTRSAAVVPTWTNSNGDTMRLCDMPTPYLRNCLTFALRMNAGYSAGSGLATALENELRVRGEQER